MDTSGFRRPISARPVLVLETGTQIAGREPACNPEKSRGVTPTTATDELSTTMCFPKMAGSRPNLFFQYAQLTAGRGGKGRRPPHQSKGQSHWLMFPKPDVSRKAPFSQRPSQEQTFDPVRVNHVFALRPCEDRESAILRCDEGHGVALVVNELRGG